MAGRSNAARFFCLRCLNFDTKAHCHAIKFRVVIGQRNIIAFKICDFEILLRFAGRIGCVGELETSGRIGLCAASAP
jgi:hypothetical protein